MNGSKGEEERRKGKRPSFPFRLLPQTLFARTFLLIAALCVLSTATWMAIFRLNAAQPRARDTAQMASSVVNLLRASLIVSAPDRRPDFFSDLQDREGIRLLPREKTDVVHPLPDERFYSFLQAEIRQRLGQDTLFALKVNDTPGFWISFSLDDQGEDEYWAILPRTRTRYEMTWQWLTWGTLALGLSLIFAWLIASRLSRPLAKLAQAAATLGHGQQPAPVIEEGAAELRQVAAAFNHMAADLADHERDRAEVLAGISHDLRTPLTRLRLEAELSIHDEASRQGIVADIEQMESIIAQFLDYARGAEGEPESLVNIEELIKEILIRHHRRGYLIENEFGCLPSCQIRPRALSRAIDNLIDNAFKYGGNEVGLHVSAANEKIMIEILDRGPGIPAHERDRAKRPFIRLDTARSGAAGTGLGLTIVERTARLHGGHFELLPREGGGLTARLTLPCQFSQSSKL